jgi:membrane protein
MYKIFLNFLYYLDLCFLLLFIYNAKDYDWIFVFFIFLIFTYLSFYLKNILAKIVFLFLVICIVFLFYKMPIVYYYFFILLLLYAFMAAISAKFLSLNLSTKNKAIFSLIFILFSIFCIFETSFGASSKKINFAFKNDKEIPKFVLFAVQKYINQNKIHCKTKAKNQTIFLLDKPEFKEECGFYGLNLDPVDISELADYKKIKKITNFDDLGNNILEYYIFTSEFKDFKFYYKQDYLLRFCYDSINKKIIKANIMYFERKYF